MVREVDASNSNYIGRNIDHWIYLVANRDYTNSDLLPLSIYNRTMGLDDCYHNLDRTCHYNNAMLALVMIEGKTLLACFVKGGFKYAYNKSPRWHVKHTRKSPYSRAGNSTD
jgi:hypothetical protein